MAQTEEQRRQRNRDAQRQHRRRKTEEQESMRNMLGKSGDYFQAVLFAPTIEEARMLALNALAALSEVTPRSRGAASQQWPAASQQWPAATTQQDGGPHGGVPCGFWPPPAALPDDGALALAWWDPVGGPGAGQTVGHPAAAEASAPVPSQQVYWPVGAFGDGLGTSPGWLQAWGAPGECLVPS